MGNSMYSCMRWMPLLPSFFRKREPDKRTSEVNSIPETERRIQIDIVSQSDATHLASQLPVSMSTKNQASGYMSVTLEAPAIVEPTQSDQMDPESQNTPSEAAASSGSQENSETQHEIEDHVQYFTINDHAPPTTVDYREAHTADKDTNSSDSGIQNHDQKELKEEITGADYCGLPEITGRDIREIPQPNHSKLCIICNAVPPDCLFLDCSHLATCVNCSKNMKDCPVCGIFILKKVKTFKI